jgi:hypothetical protein
LWFLPDDDGMERPKHVVVKQINERGKFECCVRLDLNRYLVVHRLSKNSIFSIRYIIIQFLYSKNIIVFKIFFCESNDNCVNLLFKSTEIGVEMLRIGTYVGRKDY